jgi:phytoene synthase
MEKQGLLSPVGELVRRADPDRFLTCLFAPADRRETLFVLYALNHELARAREMTREPFSALIRLQWWREIAEGARRRHEVAGPLGEALDAGWLDSADLETMIAARERETEPVETVAGFEEYLLGSAGGVMVAAGRALGMAGPEALRPWGAAYGAAGVLRSVEAHARQGRCLLPLDLVAEAGLSEGAVIADPHSPALSPVRDRVRAIARTWLASRPALPRSALAACLPVVLARRDLTRSRLTPARPWSDKVAVALAAARGRVW